MTASFLHASMACLRLVAGGCPAASNFLLLRQKKVTKEKATRWSGSFRFDPGNLRCSTPAGVGRTRFARTTAALIPPPSALLGPARRVEGRKPIPGYRAPFGVQEARSASCTGIPTDRHVCTRAQRTRPNEAPFSRPAGRGKGGGLGVGSCNHRPRQAVTAA